LFDGGARQRATPSMLAMVEARLAEDLG